MTRKRAELNEKHWEALRLLKEGKLTHEKIATSVGWSAGYFKDLVQGKVEKAGYTAELFQKELKDIERDLVKHIKYLTKENMSLALYEINKILKDYRTKKKLSLDDKKVIGSLTTVLSKTVPQVEIGSVSYQYTKGLTPEELIHEFKRLKGIAESSFDRTRVRSAEQGESGRLPEVDE